MEKYLLLLEILEGNGNYYGEVQEETKKSDQHERPGLGLKRKEVNQKMYAEYIAHVRKNDDGDLETTSFVINTFK